MGAAVVVATRLQARQPMGVGPLPHIGGWYAHSRARYVRALLSHRFRRQGRELRRHLHGSHSLEQRRAIISSNDERSRVGDQYKAVNPIEEDVMMRAAYVLATCAVVIISATAARPQHIDCKKLYAA